MQSIIILVFTLFTFNIYSQPFLQNNPNSNIPKNVVNKELVNGKRMLDIALYRPKDLRKADLISSQSNLMKAIEEFEKVIAANPTMKEAHELLDQAKKEYAKIQLNPILTENVINKNYPFLAQTSRDIDKEHNYFKVKDVKFFAGKNLNFYEEHGIINGKFKSNCGKISVAEDFTYVLNNDGLTVKGKLDFKNNTIILSSDFAIMNNVVLPKTSPTILELPEEESVYQFFETSKYYNEKNFVININHKSIKSIYTSCETDKWCKYLCYNIPL